MKIEDNKLSGRIFAEISNVLNILSEKERNKIPRDIRKLIEENKDKKYEKEILDIRKENLLPETEAYLSVIYTDYIANSREKQIILAKEKMIQAKTKK